MATKLPTWLPEACENPERYCTEQLRRLGRDYIDFYLLHALDRNRWENVLRYGVLEWAEKAQKAQKRGIIGFLGFSFHGDLPTFKHIVDSYPFTFCQVQYNYLDVDFQAGQEGVQYAAKKGLAVVVMEPLKGGQLVRLPDEARKYLASVRSDWTPASWALRWLWNQEAITVVLSGMSTMEEVRENIATASEAFPGMLTPQDLRALETVRNILKGIAPIPCTTCHYCLPCPQGVNIPFVFGLYSQVFQFKDLEGAKRTYFGFLRSEERPENCTECGTCEERCPQGIPIREWLKKVHGFFVHSSQEAM